MPCRDVVALLAEERTRRLQQLVVVRAMRMMAIHAVLAYGGVLPDERAAFFGVTLITGVIDRIGFQQRLGGRTVRIVAIDAGNFSFR